MIHKQKSLHAFVKTIAITLFSVVLMNLLTAAPPITPNSSIIESVKIDRNLQTIVITGQNLHDESLAPAVTLGGDLLTNNFFNIADDTILGYDLPVGVPDGHLELTLDSPKGLLSVIVGVKVSDSEHADDADNATHSLTSDFATNAGHALLADLATDATNAQDAVNAENAEDADTLDGIHAIEL